MDDDVSSSDAITKALLAGTPVFIGMTWQDYDTPAKTVTGTWVICATCGRTIPEGCDCWSNDIIEGSCHVVEEPQKQLSRGKM